MDIIKSITKDSSLLYLLVVEVPDGLEFEQVAWRQSSELPGGDNENSKWSFRQTAWDIDHLPVLSKFAKSLDDAQEILLAKLWESSLFQQEWSNITYEQLKLHILPYHEVCRDLPGFDTTIHVDARTIVTAGMVFFNQCAIEEKSTVFYNDRAGNFPKVMPCAFGQGWYSANWASSWHSGSNSSNDVRYSIKFGYHLKIGDMA
jgi:hypothetical protein